MAGQTEIKPVTGACRHLRERHKLESRGARSPFPERVFLRYECERRHDVEGDEAIDKCMATTIECWQEKAE